MFLYTFFVRGTCFVIFEQTEGSVAFLISLSPSEKLATDCLTCVSGSISVCINMRE